MRRKGNVVIYDINEFVGGFSGDPRQARGGKLAGALCLLVGLIPLVIATILAFHTRAFLAQAQRAQGTVVAYHTSSGTRGGSTYQPVFTFRDTQGKPWRVTSSVGSNPPTYSIGQTMTVYYDAARPDKATPGDFFSLWFASVIVGFFGIVPTIIGLILLIAFSRRRRSAN